MWCLNLSLWLHALFYNLSWICNMSADTFSFPSSPWYLSPPPPLCWCLCCCGRQDQGADLPENLLQQKKRNLLLFQLPCLTCCEVVWMVLLALRRNDWGEGMGESKGNASYSRETDLGCVKINLHEIEWHNWYLFGEKIIFKAEAASGPSMWAAEFYLVVQLLIPASPRVTMERGGFPANSNAFQGKDRKSFQ